jgi:hypothetical protein
MLAMQNKALTVNLPANMNLKHKRIFALIVKFVLCVSVIHAQNSVDSSKQKTTPCLLSTNNIVFFKQPVIKNSLPGNFYAKQLPFFCSKELQVQKAVGIPLKFRLGSVEYCDRLEGKNNSRN